MEGCGGEHWAEQGLTWKWWQRGRASGQGQEDRPRGRGNAEPGAVKLDIGSGVKWGAVGGFWRGGRGVVVQNEL